MLRPKKHFKNEQRSKDAAAKKSHPYYTARMDDNFGEWVESMGVACGRG